VRGAWTKRASRDSIGKRASARWGYPHDLSDVRAEGVVIAHCDAPQVLIQTDDGEQVWWRADMTFEIEGDE